jgi:polysaccharide export outer membrane protein
LRPEEIQIAVRDLLLGRDPGGNPVVEAHDVIRVAAARLIYVLGAVVKPGGFPISGQDSVSVLRAISLAEGLARNAAPQKAILIRESEEGKTEIPVAVNSILRGEALDPSLQGNDILFIPDSRAKTALLRSAEAAIQMATGVVIWRR